MSCAGAYIPRLHSASTYIYLVLLIEIDHTFQIEARRRAEDMLVEQKATYTIQVFGGVKHGFALRGDPAVPAESEYSYTSLSVSDRLTDGDRVGERGERAGHPGLVQPLLRVVCVTSVA